MVIKWKYFEYRFKVSEGEKMWESKTIETCEKELNTDLEKGLDEKVAFQRLQRNGKNAIEDNKKKSVVGMFLSQLNDPMIYILFAAITVSLFLKEISDSIIILAVVLLNGIIGTIQEFRAEKALDALKQLSSPMCVVKRNGTLKVIKSEELVVGDIVEIEAGKTVPADLRLFESTNMKIEESSLTGESVPSLKNCNDLLDKKTALGDKSNMAFMSTNVVNGRGMGIVVATGMRTQVGKIASLIKNEKDESTPLQKRLADLGKILGVLTITLCVVLFLIAIIQRRNAYLMLLNAISLAVAAIPEGLPAVVTIVLALGVQRMVKVNTIVRKLPSVETLGAVSVVCSDKTGTLTQNKMTVEKLYYNNNLYNINESVDTNYEMLIEGMLLCNNASYTDEGTIIGDPTEVALLELGEKYKIKKEELDKKYIRVNEKPFDSERKMMATQHIYNGHKRVYVKGAMDRLLIRCNKIFDNGKVRDLSKEDIENLEAAMKTMSENALRVLAVSYKDIGDFNEDNLIFLGMVGMIDPPRIEAKNAVNTFNEAGISTIMITGDHKDTALAIARKIGIAQKEEECISGDVLDEMSQDELNKKVMGLKVFARVSPEHKVKIVKAFKSNGKIVAMTGDGVNDAPSLKSADIGIAMGKSGTDVAKGASDMILSDDNFASIEKAIEEGRTIYANIKKAVLFLLSSNFAEIITMFMAILIGLPIPLTAIHILWVNLLTDSVPALALGSDPKDSDVMKEKPRNPKDSLFAHGGMKCTIFYGVLIGAITLLAFMSIPASEIINMGVKLNYNNVLLSLQNQDVLRKSQTFAFTTLAVCELLHAIGMRNTNKSFVRKEFFNNKLMLLAVGLGIALQVMVTEVTLLNNFFKTTQLQFFEWCYILGIALIVLLAHEMIVMIKCIKGKKK